VIQEVAMAPAACCEQQRVVDLKKTNPAGMNWAAYCGHHRAHLEEFRGSEPILGFSATTQVNGDVLFPGGGVLHAKERIQDDVNFNPRADAQRSTLKIPKRF
jgi:hypothetical protein